jgi:hypothetical protein
MATAVRPADAQVATPWPRACSAWMSVTMMRRTGRADGVAQGTGAAVDIDDFMAARPARS